MGKAITVLVFVLAAGMSVAASFWGMQGFVKYGSSGAPPLPQQVAIGVGALSYLLLLSASLPLSSRLHGHRSSLRKNAGDNLRWTSIALLLCFPLAFVFIGLVLLPFILSGSFVMLALNFLSFAWQAGRLRGDA